jgi:hypothetical protein
MATSDTFDFVFDCVIENIRGTFGNKEEGVKFTQMLLTHKVALCGYYDNIRAAIKNTYMYDPKRPLDRHKCAGAFMVAFLEKFPIKESRLNKEYFAIVIGLLILKIFISKECKDNANLCLITFLDNNKSKKGFVFPKCDCDIEPYEYNWALGMHYDRKEEAGKSVRILSPLSISNVLFFIEKYNRQMAVSQNP